MTQPYPLSSPPEDPFDSLLTLEDTLYTTAYTAGTTAGAHAGRIEGRVFGLEKGFEKFAALGALHGRSAVWAARLPSLKQSYGEVAKGQVERKDEEDVKDEKNVQEGARSLPVLPETARLANNITLLYSLTDPHTFSTDNTEDSVADFDDRFKRAGAKAKVVERIVGETHSGDQEPATSQATSQRALESSPERYEVEVEGTSAQPKAKATSKGRAQPVRRAGKVPNKQAGSGTGRGDDSMEDFAGSKLLR